jgi:hypothetical protein
MFGFSGWYSSYENEDNVSVYMYFGGLILLFPLVLVSLKWRRYSLLASCQDGSQSSWSPFAIYEVELRVRQLMVLHRYSSMICYVMLFLVLKSFCPLLFLHFPFARPYFGVSCIPLVC